MNWGKRGSMVNKKKIVSQSEDEGISTSHRYQWPTVFSGLQGMTWANLPREISAGITLAALIIPLNIKRKRGDVRAEIA
jgi:hypothetical protein